MELCNVSFPNSLSSKGKIEKSKIMDLELYVSLYVLSHPGHLHSSSSSSLVKQIREKEKKNNIKNRKTILNYHISQETCFATNSNTCGLDTFSLSLQALFLYVKLGVTLQAFSSMSQ